MRQDSAIYLLWKVNRNSYAIYQNAISTDLERTLTLFSRSHHSLTPNISQTATEYRYGHSYYRGRRGNRTQAFEWHQFQWPWVTSNPYFKVTIIFNAHNCKMFNAHLLGNVSMATATWRTRREHDGMWPPKLRHSRSIGRPVMAFRIFSDMAAVRHFEF